MRFLPAAPPCATAPAGPGATLHGPAHRTPGAARIAARRALAGRAAIVLALAAVLARPSAAAAAGPDTGARMWLPVLNYQGQDDVCRTWVEVQNAGDRLGKAVLVTWSEPSFCPPSCVGPLKTECSGLLAPGGGWALLGAQIPTGSASGVVYSFDTRRLSEIGVDLGFDDLVADHLCASLHWDMTGDCDAHARFDAALRSGGTFAGVPMAEAEGPPLAVHALRHCPGDRTPGVEVSSSYPALSDARLGRADDDGGYTYHLPALRAGDGSSGIYAQNAGGACASIELWLQAHDGCGEARICEIDTVPPGEARHVDIADCVSEGGWRGSGWLRASHPLALASDAIRGDTYTTYVAAPGDAEPATLVAPLLAPPGAGWEVEVSIQSVTPVEGGARVAVHDAAGRVLASREIALCPRGSTVVAWAGDAGPSGAGSVRVEPTGPAALAAVIEMTRRGRGQPELLESVAYTLRPVPGTPAGLVALPHAGSDLDGTGVASEIAVANLVSAPGATDFAVLLYDANGLRAVLCDRVPAAGARYIDLVAVSAFEPGLRPSAVISATRSTHAVGAGGGAGRPAIALAAVVVNRTGTVKEADIPGDEAAGSPGFALPPAVSAALEGHGAVACRPDDAAPPLALPSRPPPPAAEAAARAATVHLPVLSYQGQDDICSYRIEATNEGEIPAKLALVTWSEPGFCPPDCRGPNAVVCSGLIAPGATWVVDARDPAFSDIAFDVVDGRLLSLDGRTMREAGLSPGLDRVVADVVCDALPGVVGREGCLAFDRFHQAWLTGREWSGLAMADAHGPPVTARVARACPADRTPGIEARASYRGVPDAETVGRRGTAGRHVQFARRVRSDHEGVWSVMYIDNVGAGCAEVVLAFRTAGACRFERSCSVFALAPGEVFQFDAGDCIGPGWVGDVLFFSTEPLVILVDHVGNDALQTTRGYAGENPLDVDDDGMITLRDVQRIEGAFGTRRDDAGWLGRADLDENGVIDRADRDRLLLDACSPLREAPTPDPRATAEPTGTAPPMPSATPGVPTASPTATRNAPQPPAVYLPMSLAGGV